MNMKKTALSAAIVGVIGTAGIALPTAVSAAPLLSAGTWELTIIPSATTSYRYTSSASACDNETGTWCTIDTAGSPGSKKDGWNTSFTFGSTPGGTSVLGLNNGDNVSVTNDFSAYYGLGPGTYGTADAIQTDFGRLVFDISGTGEISGGASASFQVDTFYGTAGGNFAQFIAGPVGFSGSVDDTGAMTLGIDNRFGAIDGPTGGVIGPWNYEPKLPIVELDPSGNPVLDASGNEIPVLDASGNPTFYPLAPPLSFTTGTMPNPGPGTITGTACAAAMGGGYDCVLVSYGKVGSAWGTFTGNPYYEVWDIHLEQLSAPAIPVPAAVWLFGSGLLGLVGVARRKKVR